MRVLIVVAALTLSLASGQGGCDARDDLACTEIGCGDGVTVAVVSERFADGVYRLRVSSGGLADDCQWTISSGRIASETCNAAYGVGASYPPPEAVAVSYPAVEGPIRVVLSRDGSVVADRAVTPAYETVEPNGPDCPPVCRVARTEIVLG